MKTHGADEHVSSAWRLVAVGFVLAALFAGPIALLANMAKSQPGDRMATDAVAEPTGARPPIADVVPTDSGDVGHFALGYVEFDWDPTSPGGVPGFDSWPPGSPRR